MKKDEPIAPTGSRRWVWFSSPQSAEENRLSVLAIIETIFAIIFYIWLVLQGYTMHLLGAAFIVPLLLLKTPKSIEKGLELSQAKINRMKIFFDRALPPKIGRESAIRIPLLMVLSVPVITIIFLAAKVQATVMTVIHSPLKAVKAIPVNWWRIAGCTDSAHLPEAIPGAYRSEKSDIKYFGYILGGLVKGDYERSRITRRELILLAPASLFFVVALIFPSLLYRWSLKGSSVIYLPLVWATSGTLLERLKSLNDPFPRFRRWLGCIGIGIVSTKLLAPAIWSPAFPFLNEVDETGFLLLLIAPLTIPKWQVASAVNAMIAWVMLWTGYPLMRKAVNKSISVPAEMGFRTLGLASVVLSVYTIIILIYNIVEIQWNLEAIGDKWFPW